MSAPIETCRTVCFVVILVIALALVSYIAHRESFLGYAPWSSPESSAITSRAPSWREQGTLIDYGYYQHDTPIPPFGDRTIGRPTA